MQQWATFTGRHIIVMLWWVWALAVVLTALSESFFFDGWRRRVLETRGDGWRTVGLAALLGVLSPPSRRRIFRQAKELLAHGVSPAGVMAYLVSAQALFIWLLFFIVELSGPQPVIGQFVAVAVVLTVLTYGLRRTPERLWERGDPPRSRWLNPWIPRRSHGGDRCGRGWVCPWAGRCIRSGGLCSLAYSPSSFLSFCSTP